MLEIPLTFKSFGAASVTGLITEITRFIIIAVTKNPLYGILWGQIFGNIISYLVQSIVFGQGFILETLIRWSLVVSISLFINVKIYNYIINIPQIKKLHTKLKGLWLTLFDYLLITGSVLIIFMIWDYPMRKSYIFNVNNKNTDTIITIQEAIILLISILIFIIDQNITKNKNNNNNNNHNMDKIKDKIKDKI
jgi:hypothetical protein